jgi:hypothetical protein
VEGGAPATPWVSQARTGLAGARPSISVLLIIMLLLLISPLPSIMSRSTSKR